MWTFNLHVDQWFKWSKNSWYITNTSGKCMITDPEPISKPSEWVVHKKHRQMISWRNQFTKSGADAKLRNLNFRVPFLRSFKRHFRDSLLRFLITESRVQLWPKGDVKCSHSVLSQWRVVRPQGVDKPPCIKPSPALLSLTPLKFLS